MKSSRVLSALAAVGAATLTLSACGSDASSSASPDQVRVALLISSLSNSSSVATADGVKAEAEKQGITVDVLAAEFDPQKQYAQFQDAITTGKYQGILVQPMDGSSTCSLVPQATAAKISVGAVNSAIGNDFDTPDSNCDGVSSSVVRPFSTHGKVIGDLAVKACAELALPTCEVGFMQTAPGAPFDTAILKAFEKSIDAEPSIKLVAKANSQASRQGGFSAMQQILAGNRGVNVVVGPEQSLLGGLPAVESAKLAAAPKLVGIGGSYEGVEALKNGTLFGMSVVVPKSEGALALKNLLTAIKTGKPVAGADADVESGVPGDGLIDNSNVAQFKPEFHA